MLISKLSIVIGEVRRSYTLCGKACLCRTVRLCRKRNDAEIPLENDGENAGRAGEVALPEFVAGAGGKRGMEYELDFGPRGEPLS